jgi:hypothetical protein
MGIANPTSSFHSWILTPKETLIGSVFSLLQKQVLQNQICSMAEERISLRYDPTNPSIFIQRDAELQGQIGILKYLISLSDEAEKQLNPGVSNITIIDPGYSTPNPQE